MPIHMHKAKAYKSIDGNEEVNKARANSSNFKILFHAY